MNIVGSFLINVAAFAVLAVGGGLGTAWYMIEFGLAAVDAHAEGRG